jgi:hypothetical protein
MKREILGLLRGDGANKEVWEQGGKLGKKSQQNSEGTLQERMVSCAVFSFEAEQPGF